MANTEFSYMYRDASNWKQFETVVLAGEISQQDIDLIMSKLEDGNLFIPEQVGLSSLQGKWPLLNNDDHIWHELRRDDLKIVDISPTISVTTKELVENFRNISWDVSAACWKICWDNDFED
jgi:hypothetical protein